MVVGGQGEEWEEGAVLTPKSKGERVCPYNMTYLHEYAPKRHKYIGASGVIYDYNTQGRAGDRMYFCIYIY